MEFGWVRDWDDSEAVLFELEKDVEGALEVPLGAREVTAGEFKGIATVDMLHEGNGLEVARFQIVEVGIVEGAIEGGFEFEQGGLDGRETIDAPEGVGCEADGVGFGLVGWLEGLDVGFEVEVVGGAVLFIDDELGAGETMFAGVEGGCVLALFGDGSGGVLFGGGAGGDCFLDVVELGFREVAFGVMGGEFVH